MVHIVGIVGIDLDRRHIAVLVEIGLALGQRHEDEGAVIFGHADLEHRRNLVDLDARGRAHGRDGAARGDQSEVVTRLQRELVGEPLADGNAGAPVEAIQRALLDVGADGRKLAQIFFGNAAHQNSAGIVGGGSERLPFHQRNSQRDARHARDALGDRVIIGERAVERLHQKMPVEAEDLGQELGAEPVHHRHDDDERRDAQHDAEEGKAGDDRDEAFLAARAQVAQRQHPLEGAEGARARGLLARHGGGGGGRIRGG